MSTRHGIVVLDFGGQYTQLIARRIREQQVFSAILPCTASRRRDSRARTGRAWCSRAAQVRSTTRTRRCAIRKFCNLGVPVLGICYGMQWLTHTLGGKVERAERREYGPAQLDIESGSSSFRRLAEHAQNLEQPRRSRGRLAGRVSRHRAARTMPSLPSRIPRKASTACNFIRK